MFNEYASIPDSRWFYLERKQINVSFRSTQTWETSVVLAIGLSRNVFVVVEICSVLNGKPKLMEKKTFYKLLVYSCILRILYCVHLKEIYSGQHTRI